MLARDFVIILALFGGIVGIGALIVVDMANSETGYNVTNMTDENFQSNYDTLSDTFDDVELMKNATASSEGISVLSTYTTVFKATFNVITLIFRSPILMKNVFNTFTDEFNIDTDLSNIMFTLILTISLAIIIFVIISSVSKGRM